MTDLVRYAADGTVARITLDDGKANALSPAMQLAINNALDRAERDGVKAVVLAGHDRLFCGGFDLKVLAAGDREAVLDMLGGGFTLAARLLRFPKPIVIAATGPAVAMGSFLLLSGDHRVGSERTRCQANEVAIGMALPTSAVEIMRMRLTPAAFQRGISMAAPFVGQDAVAGGWLDEIVDSDKVVMRADEVAASAAQSLDAEAHRISKSRARAAAVDAILAGVQNLATEFVHPAPTR
jgi:enoyl-CoA hydratase